jgi:hypothetical protein
LPFHLVWFLQVCHQGLILFSLRLRARLLRSRLEWLIVGKRYEYNVHLIQELI